MNTRPDTSTLSITLKASIMVLGFLEDEENNGKALRVYVEGGGCAGFQYGLLFDNKRDTDVVITCEGFELIVDPMSQMYLEGAIVDFVDGLYGAGFKINNPNATGSCGCGHSFST